MATFAERLDLSTPHTLRNEAEYRAAVAEIDELLALDPAPGTREYDRLDLLSVLVEAFDDEHYQMGEAVTPQAVVDFLLAQHGMARAELAPLFGGRSRVSEFFAGKRSLSLTQIQQLRRRFHVPADVLMEPIVA
jgi:HTH-type transcriptional regulator / antitoxin HigA